MNRALPKVWTIWWAITTTFIVLSLWPIWSTRFPPLQDYPQHLLHAKILAERNNPKFDYGRYFEIHFRPVYATFFAVAVPLAKFLPIEIAGKAALTLYVALVAALVIELARRRRDEDAPWGLLLLFPFTFNQQYFQGNINFCYSLPILVLALLDQEDLAKQPMSLWNTCRHFLWQLALFISHPFTFLLYLGLTGLRIVYLWRKRDQSTRDVSILLVMGGILYLAWLIVGKLGGDTSAIVEWKWSLFWTPVSEMLGFYCCMFTGLRWHDGVDAGAVVSWLIIGACILGSLLTTRQQRESLGGIHLIFFVIATAGVFLLPFSINYYTFINARLAAVSYFLLVLVIGRIGFQKLWAVVFVLCVGATLLQSVTKQGRVSKEIEAIVPIIQNIPPNARILPLVFVRTSPELDPAYFDPHLHVHDYYHLLIGGGINPYFLEAPIHPVHLKHDIALPAPGEYSPHLFRWEQHADNYQYFLVRGAPLLFVVYLTGSTELRAKSDEWSLFERKPIATPAGSSPGTPNLSHRAKSPGSDS